MTFTYPAVFHKEADGSFTGYFPDLEGCSFGGTTLDEAINSAIAAEKTWIEVQAEDENEGMPFISDPADISLQEGEFIRTIGVIMHFEEGFY